MAPLDSVAAVEARDVPVVAYEDLVAKRDLSAVVEEAFGYEGMGILVVSGVPELGAKRSDLLPLAFAFAQLPDDVKAKCELPEAFYSFGWSHGKENLQGKPDYAKGSYYNNPEVNDLANGDQQLVHKFPSFYHPNIWPKGAGGGCCRGVSRLHDGGADGVCMDCRAAGAGGGLHEAGAADRGHGGAGGPPV
ncbi:hypothetical protein ON010_g15879 [Phytophthora cinnamomi]|nr:hypothetical protein ON010_g15879 [Phytophthora cinnamomi]